MAGSGGGDGIRQPAIGHDHRVGQRLDHRSGGLGAGRAISQGQEGRVYRYIVKSPEGSGGSISTPLDLRTQNYKDTDKWQLVDKLKVSILKERKWAVTAPEIGRAHV